MKNSGIHGILQTAENRSNWDVQMRVQLRREDNNCTITQKYTFT